MAHVRKQIRDALVSALTGLATTKNNVHAQRVYPQTKFPSLNIILTDEVDEQTIPSGKDRQDRNMSIIIEARVKAVDGLVDDLDKIDQEVTQKLYDEMFVQTGSTLASLLHDLDWVSFGPIEFTDEHDQQVMMAPITFDAAYRVNPQSLDAVI